MYFVDKKYKITWYYNSLRTQNKEIKMLQSLTLKGQTVKLDWNMLLCDHIIQQMIIWESITLGFGGTMYTDTKENGTLFCESITIDYCVFRIKHIPSF